MTLVCILCGSPEVIAAAPGVEPQLVLDLFAETRGEPAGAWCAACWPNAPTAEPEPVARGLRPGTTTRLLRGDCRTVLPTLPAESVQCVVTSPPYYGLRDYNVAGQIGLEPTLDEYVATMVAVFREVRRVLRRDGTLWLNLGDSYAASTKGSGGHNPKQDSNRGSWMDDRRWRIPNDLKPKDLLGMPWRVAFALQADGWWLRSAIVWAKPNPMPESVTDRPTNAYELVFLLAKRAAYYFDADAVREERLTDSNPGSFRDNCYVNGNIDNNTLGKARSGPRQAVEASTGRNARNVWTIATQAFPDAHFATFPVALTERCIKAGTSERGCCPHCGAPWVRAVEIESRPNAPSLTAKYNGKGVHRAISGGVGNDACTRIDRGWRPSCACPAAAPVPCTVLDPFAGAGTTGLAADRLGRSAVLIELSADYAEMARARVVADAPLFAWAEGLA